MIRAFRRAMDALYLCSALIASVSLVLISAVIPWGVYTRYVVNRAASWPEPMAILLTIVLTFFGAAVCYRSNQHMRVAVLSHFLPPVGKFLLNLLVELLMGAICVFMIVWGIGLVEATWPDSIAEFPFLSVGVTYLPIPIGGVVTLLFVIERVTIGPPQLDVAAAHGGGRGSIPVD